MDLQSQDTIERRQCQYSFYREQEINCSFHSFCYFLLLFIFLGVTLLGILAILIIFILRPRKPIFAVQALRVDSVKLNGSDGSNVYASSVISLMFTGQNPNIIGIRYSPTQLHVLYGGIPVGEAELPEFYQPAHSKNVTVQMLVLVDRLNVSQIAIDIDSTLKDSPGKSLVMIRVIGDIKAHVRILHVALPRIKVAVDCTVGVDYRGIVFNKGIHLNKAYKIHSKSPSFSRKCSFAVYI